MFQSSKMTCTIKLDHLDKSLKLGVYIVFYTLFSIPVEILRSIAMQISWSIRRYFGIYIKMSVYINQLQFIDFYHNIGTHNISFSIRNTPNINILIILAVLLSTYRDIFLHLIDTKTKNIQTSIEGNLTAYKASIVTKKLFSHLPLHNQLENIILIISTPRWIIKNSCWY